jgi:hypothetical protein
MTAPYVIRNRQGCTPCSSVTLNLTVRGCDNGTQAGVSIRLTQGATNVTAVSNMSGVATFSLPSTGTWTWAPNPATTGYTTAGGTITGIVAGANSRTVTLTVDHANNYFCDGCGNPVLSVTAVVNGPGITGTTTQVITWNAAAGVPTSPWFPGAGPIGSGIGPCWIRCNNVGSPTNTPSIAFSGVPLTSPAPTTEPPPGGQELLTTIVSASCSPYSTRRGGANWGATYTH